MPAKPKSFDDALATVSADKRPALEKLRKQIRSAAPKAVEGINYGLAAFLIDGKPIVAIGAAAKHCSLFPMTGHTVEAFKGELKDFETSKGAIRFTPEKPLSAALVRKIVKARIAENEVIASKAKTRPVKPKVSTPSQLPFALDQLQSKSTQHDIENLKKFAINPTKFFGVSMANMKSLAKQLGRNHELAAELWESGWYEARMLATMVDEPEKVTSIQMDRWCKDFDNWGIVDTACFCLFDRTPHAFSKVAKWCKLKGEFQKRAAFALLWSLSLHDKNSQDKPFLECLPLIEKAATDERNFVKKGVNMALRAVGRRSRVLNQAAIELAERLAKSEDATAKWIGKDALKELKTHKFGK